MVLAEKQEVPSPPINGRWVLPPFNLHPPLHPSRSSPQITRELVVAEARRWWWLMSWIRIFRTDLISDDPRLMPQHKRVKSWPVIKASSMSSSCKFMINFYWPCFSLSLFDSLDYSVYSVLPWYSVYQCLSSVQLLRNGIIAELSLTFQSNVASEWIFWQLLSVSKLFFDLFRQFFSCFDGLFLVILSPLPVRFYRHPFSSCQRPTLVSKGVRDRLWCFEKKISSCVHRPKRLLCLKCGNFFASASD